MWRADAHVHVPPDGEDARTFLRLFVANGITSVMNLSGTAGHLRLRQQLAQGAILGPQMFTSGPPVDTRHGLPDSTSAGEIAEAVVVQKRAG